VVGYVGTLKREHDIGTVIDAAMLLSADGSPVHLLVVGDGPEAKRLAGQAHVIQTGAVSNDVVPEYLSAMDVVVVPHARNEPGSFSPSLQLAEAMAMARPVVAARTAQAERMITSGDNGVLYEPGDAPDLACKIHDILERPDRGASLGAAARQHMLAAHTWEHNARRIVELARRIIDNTNGV
jgi:glycosyltransferase involved in cell wall biosynthesis